MHETCPNDPCRILLERTQAAEATLPERESRLTGLYLLLQLLYGAEAAETIIRQHIHERDCDLLGIELDGEGDREDDDIDFAQGCLTMCTCANDGDHGRSCKALSLKSFYYHRGRNFILRLWRQHTTGGIQIILKNTICF